MKLSKRLQAIADCIIKYKKGVILADIGTDHAYLPCYLMLEHEISHAYACDIAEGPLQASMETIALNNLEKDVIPLLGSGMNPILNKEVDMISICGMGGKLTVDILDEHQEMLDDHLFILQSNIGIEVLRQYLYEHQMIIIDENIVKDAHHIYEIIICEKARHSFEYGEKDIVFGPCLRKKRDVLFLEKWEHQLRVQKRILTSLSKDHSRYQEVKHLIKLIEGELYESY